MYKYKIQFEMVSPHKYPQYYCDGDRNHQEHFVGNRDDIPDEHWHQVHREGDEFSIHDQYTGIQQLIADGEPLRNVRVFRTAIDWRPYTFDDHHH